MDIFWRRTFLTLVAVSILVACDDKRTATAENFAHALQSYYDDNPECIALPIDFPIGTPVGVSDPRRQQAKALVAAGLLSETAVDASATVQYSLTTVGEKAIRKGPDPFLGGMTLCFARRKIAKITLFTPPAEVMGIKASRVTYDYELRDIAAWAKSQSFQEAFPQIKDALAQPIHSGTNGMVLTDEGWRDEHIVR